MPVLIMKLKRLMNTDSFILIILKEETFLWSLVVIAFHGLLMTIVVYLISGLAGATADVHCYDVLTNKWSR